MDSSSFEVSSKREAQSAWRPAPCGGLAFSFSDFRFQLFSFSAFSFQLSVFQFSVFSFQFSVFSFQFSAFSFSAFSFYNSQSLRPVVPFFPRILRISRFDSFPYL